MKICVSLKKFKLFDEINKTTYYYLNKLNYLIRLINFILDFIFAEKSFRYITHFFFNKTKFVIKYSFKWINIDMKFYHISTFRQINHSN